MQEMRGLSKSIPCITHLGVTCLLIFLPIAKICTHALAFACASNLLKLAGWRFKMVENMALLLPKKAFNIKKCLVIWHSYSLKFVMGRTLNPKMFKNKAPHIKKCNPANLASWACMANLKVQASILGFKGWGLTSKLHDLGLKVPLIQNLEPTDIFRVWGLW